MKKGNKQHKQHNTKEYYAIEKNLLDGIIQKSIGLLIIAFCIVIMIMDKSPLTSIGMTALMLYGFKFLLSSKRIRIML